MSRYTLTVGPDATVTRHDRRAARELPRADLRDLPADLLTHDPDDPNRIHEIDPPHIVQALADEALKPKAEERSPDVLDKPEDADPRLTQWKIDIVRLRVLRQLAKTAMDEVREGLRPDIRQVFHLWFPYDDIRVYQLVRGNPPPDIERPVRLRRMKIEIDLSAGIPASVAAAARDAKTRQLALREAMAHVVEMKHIEAGQVPDDEEGLVTLG